MTDEVEVEAGLLRRLRPPVAGPEDAFVVEERNTLMAFIAETTHAEVDPAPLRQRARPRRRWLLPVVVLASATGVGAGWAILRPDPQTSTAVACGDAIISSTTGDPIADCAARWRRDNGTEPPQLVAYVGPGGGILVIPATQEPPTGSSPLAPSFRQEAAIIELRAELADVSRGLKSHCFREADARRLVQQQLQRLGLADWTIRTRPAERSAPERCPAGGPTYSAAALNPDEKQVLLLPNEGGGPPPRDLPFVKLAQWLTQELVEGPNARCLPVEEAATLAREQAARLGLRESIGEVVFNIVPATDSSRPTCARATTVVGGATQVTIRAAAR
jgi:hypothetical protein